VMAMARTLSVGGLPVGPWPSRARRPFQDLRDAGRVRAIGVWNFHAEHLEDLSHLDRVLRSGPDAESFGDA
jgi:aryl-alcohol dehydrogenase-like predicted oxidoreductase